MQALKFPEKLGYAERATHSCWGAACLEAALGGRTPAAVRTLRLPRTRGAA